MEVYALLALGGAGLYAARNFGRSESQRARAKPVPVPGNVPSVNSLYDATHLAKVARIEKRRADAHARQRPPELIRDVDFGPINVSRQQQQPQQVRSQLAGVDIPVEHFTHNNMEPFFRGDMKQNMDPAANVSRLEHMTGNDGFFRPPGAKREMGPMFAQERGETHGTPLATDTWRERIVVPTARRNEFPIPQVTVGPGLGQGFTAAPSDSYGLDQRQYAMPRDTDDVRAANKPKMTFEGRVLPGQGAQTLPTAKDMGAFDRNRPETTFERPHDWYQPTTGAYLKETGRPKIETKAQARDVTTKSYAGAAFSSANPDMDTRPDVRPARHQNLASFATGPIAATNIGRGLGDDKGKSSITILDNRRNATTSAVYQGNVATLVKSFTAPLLDMVKPNRSACPHIVFNPREDGNLKGPSRTTVYNPDEALRATLRETLAEEDRGLNLRGGPSRLPVRDPEAVARPTMKQTMLQESEALNFRGGPSRLPVHDPEDITRTTLRQTTLQESEALNFRGGPSRLPAYDPEDVTRATMRQTMLQESEALNFRGGPSRLPVHDPEDSARATTRQTTLQEAETLNFRGPSRLPAHDPEDTARTTLRESLLQEYESANLTSQCRGQAVYETDDDARTTHRQTLGEEDGGNVKSRVPNPAVWDQVARNTMKQTLVDAERETGNPDGLEGQRGAYEVTEYDAPRTQKESLSDTDYYGATKRDMGEGYATAPTDLRPSAKAALSDNDYYGTAGDTRGTQTSHADYDNATFDASAEMLLVGRDPTRSSTKVAAGSGDAGAVTHRKVLFDADDRRLERIVLRDGATMDAIGAIDEVTHLPQAYADQATDRLDAEADGNRAQMAQNPYNIRMMH